MHGGGVEVSGGGGGRGVDVVVVEVVEVDERDGWRRLRWLD